MSRSRSLWALARFEIEFDLWVERANPSLDLRVVVLDWTLSRMVDPYQGAVREPDFDNLWRARIPESMNERDESVYSVYFLHERQKLVDCRGFEFNAF